MKTFSQHLIRSLVPGLLLVLLCSGFLIKFLVARSLTSEFDRALGSRAESLMVITEQDEDGIELEVYPEALGSYFQQFNPDYFVITNSNGERIFRSASLDAEQRLLRPGSIASDQAINITLPDGRSGRLLQKTYYPKIDIDDDDKESAGVNPGTRDRDAQAFAPSGSAVQIGDELITPEQLKVTVAVSRQVLDSNLMQLNVILLLAGLFTTTAFIVLQRIAILRAVRPIQSMSEQISIIDVNKMGSGLTLDYPISELVVLKDRFNHLMKRLHDGFQRERLFSADLAHEIRTPLAELRTLVEVSKRWPADEKINSTLHDDVLGSVDRMERLVQSLLELSRGDQGLLEPTDSIDLTELVNQVCKQHQPMMDAKNIRLGMSVPDQFVMVNGQEHWSMMLENLVDNACEYSPEDAVLSVHLSVEELDRRVVLKIENAAPDLAAKDVALMFDRLWRKDESRSGNRHSGLGLALVKTYAKAVNAEVKAVLLENRILRITVTGYTAQPAAI